MYWQYSSLSIAAAIPHCIVAVAVVYMLGHDDRPQEEVSDKCMEID